LTKLEKLKKPKNMKVMANAFSIVSSIQVLYELWFMSFNFHHAVNWVI